MKTIISIDPGANGGIAIFRDWASKPIETHPMPETQGDVLDLFEEIRDIELTQESKMVCVLEQVGGFAGKRQPGSAMFKFGENFGFIKGVIQTLGIRLLMVTPQKWQKHFSLGTASNCASKTEWKNKLKAEAQRRYPSIKVTLNTADALLILEWAKQQPELK